MDPSLINLRHLAAVAATVRQGTVTAAAREVNLTQPALTQAIAKVETQLGCTLFERGTSGMRPTGPALLLADRVDKAVALIGSPRVTGTQMRAFRALARAGSYAGAAEFSALSPASLHRSVKDLSLALNQRLIEKRGRTIHLTRAGARRARSFGLAAAELRNGLAEVNAWLGRAAGRIVIGAMPLSRARWLPSAMVKFLRAEPNVEIIVVEGSYAEMITSLRDGEIDFLLGALRPDEHDDDVLQEASFEDLPQVIMRKGHPMEGERCGPVDLASYPWILPSIKTPLRQYWHKMFQDCGIEPPSVGIECGSVLTARELMLRTEALTLLSTSQLRVELDAGLLVSSPPPRKVVRTIGIYSRRDWRATAPQARMLDILRELARSDI